MKRRTIFLAVCVFFCLASNVFSGEAIGPDKIKAMLLKPNGWIAEYHGSGYAGTAETIFEERDDKIIAIISRELNPDNRCERPVTITSEGFTMDGCNDANMSLVFDQNDQEYPFKGKSSEVYYKAKEK